MDLPHLLLGDGQIGAPDPQQVGPERKCAVAEVGVFQRQPEGDNFAGYRLIHFRHDRLDGDLGVGDIALVGQRSLLLHRRGKCLHDGTRVDAAVGIGKEPAYFLLQRTQKVVFLLKPPVKDGLEIVGQQLPAPRIGDRLQAVDELHRHVGGLRHLVNRVAVQGLFDGSVLPIGNGHQDFGQVIGSAELKRFSARQSISWLVPHNVVDDVGGTRAATFNQGFEFRDAQVGAYGLATAVSLARVASSQHFLSDVFVGGLIGYQVGRHVFNERHNTNLDDDLKVVAKETSRPNPNHLASTYVPLDSWVYSAIERLLARGYINTAFAGLKPYTRLSCARMLVELNSNLEYHTDVPPDIYQLKKSLDAEFAEELGALEGRPFESIRLDTLYTRITGISGTPLTDSSHFGQTIFNDEGRPYGEGVSNITGFSARAEDGQFAFYVDGEYQHAPSLPAYPLSVREVIAQVDQEPLQPAMPVNTINRFRLLDTYTAVKLLGLDFSVGKQSLWWGPSESGSMLMSNNAEPFWMIQANRTDPLYIPGMSKFLGPFRSDFYFGKLAGHDLFPVGPYFFGQKVSFKPTENLEIGFTRDDVFAGEGHVPLTFGSFWNSFTSFQNVPLSVKFSRNDPGARHAEFDFTWRVPKLHHYLTLYSNSIVHDNVSAVPRARAGVNPGIYLTRFPKFPKLDFRAEAAYTDAPAGTVQHGQFLYYEVVYRDLYLNNGNLMGSWVGREGNGYQAWSTYSISPQSNVQASFRYAKISKDFIPGGSTQWDATVSTMLRIRKELQLKAFLQYESWLEPVVAPNRQRDVTTSVEFTWWPGLAASRPLSAR